MLSRHGALTVLPELDAIFAPVVSYGRIGVAVSGGADSLALLLLAAQWAGADHALFIYVVDHQLRREAAGEAAFVADQAERLGLPVRILRWEGLKPKAGIPAAARAARYQLISQAMAEDKVQVLLTAHHAGDQAETILMRLAHGSGLGGLGGMDLFSNVEGVNVCRPLLSVAPDALAHFVMEAGIVPVADPSNHDSAFERVRWRRMLPVLADLDLDLGRLSLFAARARRANKALDMAADTAFDTIAMIDDFGAVHLRQEGFVALAEELQVRVLKRSLGIGGGGRKPFALGQVEHLAAELGRNRPVAARTLLGCVVEASAGAILVMREPSRLPQSIVRLRAGESVVWDERFLISNKLAVDLEIKPASTVRRAVLEHMLERSFNGRMKPVRGAPCVSAGGDQVLAIGTRSFDAAVNVEFTSSLRQ